MPLLLFLCSLIFFIEAHATSVDWQQYYPNAQIEVASLANQSKMGISLGSNCNIASRFAEYQIRTFAFPFDWLITPAESLHALIENDFHDFLNLENFQIENEIVLIDTKYKLKFHHDMDATKWQSTNLGLVPKHPDALNDYEEMVHRYGRRIARFYAFLDSEIPIYLLRRDITKEQAIELQHLLKIKFPNSNLTIVCLEWKIDGEDEDWLVPGILHFCIGRDGQNPAFPHPDYHRIFLQLGLISE